MAETEFMYDVFISYNHRDEEWVVGTLLPALEKAGLKVCIDYKDLEAGDVASAGIENAIAASRAAILVLTQNWFKGKWTHFEAQIAVNLDPSGKTRKIIPLICEAGIEKEIPQAIARYNRIDFVKDQTLAWKQLLAALDKPDTTLPEAWKSPARIKWFYGHRYGDLENFTGRADEIQMLDDWLANDADNLLLITAFGGFGKSALTWTWFNNRVDKTKWQTAVWWSFYEKESGFDSFLAETLTYFGIETKERSTRQQVNDLLDVMQNKNMLIVLDGFERLLRQYSRMDAALQEDEEDSAIDPSQRDCASLSAEIFLRGLSDKKMISKVLMTSRLLPLALESRDGKLQRGCREVNLKAFSPADAAAFFHKHEIKGRRDEIEAVCELYGYHPLSLSLLVGLINADHEKRGDIEAVKNLEIFADVKARRHHVLERAYESLAPERRDLLSKMSCFRGSMEYAVLKKVFPSPDLDKSLLDLRQRGLLQYAGETQRYDMHPIVRHYAYDHFTDEKRRKEAHVQLAMHFIDVMPVTNKNVKTLEDLAPVIELYHHMVGAGNLDDAWKLYYDRLHQAIYFQFGAYQLQIELLRALFLDGEDKLPRLKRENAQASTLNMLANTYALSGQPCNAVPLFEKVNILLEKACDKKNLAIGLGNLAKTSQLPIGALSTAERTLRRSINVCYQIKDESREAVAHMELGRVLSYRGVWQEAEREFELSFNYDTKINDRQGLSSDWSYRALRLLLMVREDVTFDTRNSSNENRISAIRCAQYAFELAEGGDPNIGGAIVSRDLVRTRWLLGSAYLANNELTRAEENLSKALNLCRQINAVDGEADILLDVARLSFAYGSRYGGGGRVDEVRIETPPPTRPSVEAEKYFQDALEKASEALVITERSGYVLQGADVHLFLAELAMKGYVLQDTRYKLPQEAARFHAEAALKLAYCDGGEYKYKVAYEEAERLLKELGG